jgi:hypothetical protein
VAIAEDTYFWKMTSDAVVLGPFSATALTNAYAIWKDAYTSIIDVPIAWTPDKNWNGQIIHYNSSTWGIIVISDVI